MFLCESLKFCLEIDVIVFHIGVQFYTNSFNNNSRLGKQTGDEERV